MKYDIIILIVPTFIIILTVFIRLKATLPKALFICLVSLCMYLALGIYVPALFRLLDLRTQLSKIIIVDEQGKPVPEVGVTLSSTYAIGNYDFNCVEYRRESAISDENGNLLIHRHVKPLPIILFPLLLRFYDGTGCFLYKRGYYPYLTNIESFGPTAKIILTKSTDKKHMFYLLDKYHYLHYKNIENFTDRKSAEIYAQIYRGLMEEARLLHAYDNYNVIADSYTRIYNRISSELGKKGVK